MCTSSRRCKSLLLWRGKSNLLLSVAGFNAVISLMRGPSCMSCTMCNPTGSWRRSNAQSLGQMVWSTVCCKLWYTIYRCTPVLPHTRVSRCTPPTCSNSSYCPIRHTVHVPNSCASPSILCTRIHPVSTPCKVLGSCCVLYHSVKYSQYDTYLYSVMLVHGCLSLCRLCFCIPLTKGVVHGQGFASPHQHHQSSVCCKL